MEYLFQGKCKDSGKWVFGDLIHRKMWAGELTIIRETDDECDNYEEYIVIPKTVGQFTGFKDKKGNKIFKGHIVRYFDEDNQVTFIGEICFEHGAFGLGSHQQLPLALGTWLNNDNFVSLFDLYWNLDCCQDELPMLEIIGNIYDNLELLGGVNI